MVDPTVEAALRDAAARLAEAGWQITETDCPPLREPARLQANLWLSEARRTGRDVVDRENDPDASFVFAQMEKRCPEPDLHALLDTLQARASFTRQWQQFLQTYPVLICPVSAELPFPDLLDVESPDTFARVMEAQLLQIATPFMGLPGLTVSTGMTGDTPVGVQLIGGRYREDVLFRAGEVISAAGAPQSPIDPR